MLLLGAFFVLTACQPNGSTNRPSATATAPATATATAPAIAAGFHLTMKCQGPMPPFTVTVDDGTRAVEVVGPMGSKGSTTAKAADLAPLEGIVGSADFDAFMSEEPSGKIEEGEVVSCTVSILRGGTTREHSWMSNDKMSPASTKVASALSDAVYKLRMNVPMQ